MTRGSELCPRAEAERGGGVVSAPSEGALVRGAVRSGVRRAAGDLFDVRERNGGGASLGRSSARRRAASVMLECVRGSELCPRAEAERGGGVVSAPSEGALVRGAVRSGVRRAVGDLFDVRERNGGGASLGRSSARAAGPPPSCSSACAARSCARVRRQSAVEASCPRPARVPWREAPCVLGCDAPRGTCSTCASATAEAHRLDGRARAAGPPPSCSSAWMQAPSSLTESRA